jgi:hypothetical protein
VLSRQIHTRDRLGWDKNVSRGKGEKDEVKDWIKNAEMGKRGDTGRKRRKEG